MKHATSFCQGVTRLLVSMAPEECYLVIDRTNWKLGERPINLLCPGLIVGERFYLPLLCEPLDKHGSSKTDERIGLLKQLMALKTPGKKYVLLADREFISRTWLRRLRNQGIEMVIRVREGDYLISTIPDPRQSGELYTKRWSIEVFFKQLKSDGFHLESIGLYEPNRLRMLMAVASVAYMIVLQEGFRMAEKRPIKIKRSPGRGRKWAAVLPTLIKTKKPPSTSASRPHSGRFIQSQ